MKHNGNRSGSNRKPQTGAPAVVAAASEPAGNRGILLWPMIALSGFACLVYQILWMRRLGLLFGNTSQAAALTLAVFFGGLAVGGWFWGHRCKNLTNPARAFAWLELGIAACGLLVLAAPGVVQHFLPLIYQRHGQGAALVFFKAAWTLLMVFPPAVLMGGTLPVIGQAVIRHASAFGATTARLYAVNTVGAAAGAFAAAFVLIPLLGVRLTCAAAMLASLAACALAFALSRQGLPAPTQPADAGKKRSASAVDARPLSRAAIRGIAFLSGFNLLALEVVWTRMLAQVHENSVYGFSTVLIVVLACLALGAWLASWLARGKSPAPQTLIVLVVAGGIALCISPFIFAGLTDNLMMLPTDASFTVYVLRIFGTATAAIGPPCLLLGAVFPFLMKAEERFADQPGQSIGALAAVNTLGAILGALAAGFLLLEWLGLWRSIQCIAAVYLIAALLIPAATTEFARVTKIVAALMLPLAFTVFAPSRLPSSWTKDPMGKNETLLEKWEGSDCTVAVVKDSLGHVAIKINSNYSLGSTSAFAPQIFQARIPLLAFPATDSVFFIGMGTGITAGEALDKNSYPSIETVAACELSPGVVAASEKYFAGGNGEPDLTRGLYQDPRATVLVEDGRNHLMATAAQYGMINADLFLPYRRGTGNLYSREHFESARARLKPGGVYVQWLPLYQISGREFGIIARTMNSVFPHVSLWRGNFQPGAEIAALVGHVDDTPVAASDLDAEAEKRAAVEWATHLDIHNLQLPINEQTIPFFYCGNVGRAADLFEKHPLNTDDRPVIEFGTPRSLHRPAAEGKPQFLQDRFADLVDLLQQRTPPMDDPLLAARTPASRNLAVAGAAFHRASIASVTGDDEAWQRQWKTFLQHWITDAE